VTVGTTAKGDDGLAAMLARQRAAFLRDGPPPLPQRRSDLMKLKNVLREHREHFAAAINTDFGHRSRQETSLFDLASVVEGINFMRRNLRRWMKPERRRVGVSFVPASNRVLYQPLGVVGIIAPWNYPVALALMPLATALAAGNRAMIKPSELTPQTSALMESVLGDVFARDQVAVVTGDTSVAVEFSGLPFDHLFFTGSTSVGRAIMRAASDNLVPVTLELGESLSNGAVRLARPPGALPTASWPMQARRALRPTMSSLSSKKWIPLWPLMKAKSQSSILMLLRTPTTRRSLTTANTPGSQACSTMLAPRELV
jgi:coniferyl-aldehyde dehydrogenase